MADGWAVPSLRWPAGFAALVKVLAYAQCREMVRELQDEHRNQPNVSVAFLCERPDDTVADPKLWWPAAAPGRPAPIPANCATGSGRPAVGTVGCGGAG
jgi:L-aminopeptidase/D-esterase-like protein